ncbi:isoprenyl transferase [Sphingorhabdus soli]|uniref:Isoprenyl transferase n=1 Tax=Flavisphingopyxis soli TaxID=2601267 RepID=A0A5C6U721_9SPHN|nr:isoprenyl transferase [Sphingorhabdus soli]TXC68813.1 isoprenyl transferase [Sphingorhabdus soli]
MADISIPRHVAIIMDGNGRWAKRRHLPRAAGHKAGVDAVRKTVRAAKRQGLEALTLYAFSSENWKRPEDEISDLMGLMKRFILSDLEKFAEEDVKLHIIGDYSAFKPDVVKLIDDALERTSGNKATTLAVALNYGSQDEITRVARSLATDAAAGTIDPASIDEAMVAARLDTADLPPLDLVIRTSGEQRLSNFLLWQAAYAEMYFTDMLWPDFDGDALKAALDWFAARERRFGGR